MQWIMELKKKRETKEKEKCGCNCDILGKICVSKHKPFREQPVFFVFKVKQMQIDPALKQKQRIHVFFYSFSPYVFFHDNRRWSCRCRFRNWASAWVMLWCRHSPTGKCPHRCFKATGYRKDKSRSRKSQTLYCFGILQVFLIFVLQHFCQRYKLLICSKNLPAVLQ